MKINFNGTYKISGNSIVNSTPTTLANFLKESRTCRKDNSYSYIDKENFDYFVAIKDDKESKFDKIAKKYNIEAKKHAGKNKGVFIAWNTHSSEYEFGTIIDAISRYFYG